MNVSVKSRRIISPIFAIALCATSQPSLAADQGDPYEDGRTAILVQPEIRNHILSEMRAFLETTQAIIEAAVEGDLETVTELASAMGMSAAGGVPPQTMSKLPPEFRMMAGSTHKEFDELALAASVSEDPLDVLGGLATLMYNCTACHSSFRLGVEVE